MNEISLKMLIQDRLDSGIPVLYIVAEDDKRPVNYVRNYFSRKGKEVIIFDPATNFSCDSEEQFGENFVEIVSDWLNSRYLEGKQLILRDFHRNLEDIRCISAIKQIIRKCKNTQIVMVSNIVVVPRELEHYVTVLISPLPTSDEIKRILGPNLSGNSKILNAALGLEEIDIQQIMRQVLAEEIEPDKQVELFIKKKVEMINKTGILSVEDTIKNPDCLGGYTGLKSWLEIQKSVLDKEPDLLAKGMILLGITGCGKSLCAKVTAGILEQPLLRMEFGKIVNKYVGESENNLLKLPTRN